MDAPEKLKATPIQVKEVKFGKACLVESAVNIARFGDVDQLVRSFAIGLHIRQYVELVG